MVEPGHDLANHMLELREVHQKPGRVELRPFKGHANAVIMTVHVLALASVSAKGMSCRKGLFYADLKHVSPKLRCTLAADLQPFRKDLPNGPPAARSHPWHQETGRHRPARASSRIVAATPGKFYHRACAGGGPTPPPAPPGGSSSE